jgi:uncharacterized membrane protein
MQLRKLLTCLLLLSAGLTIALIPEGSSQQFTTSTTLLTSIWTQTTTYYSESYYSATSTSVAISSVTAQMTSYDIYKSCYFFSTAFESAVRTVHIHFSGGFDALYILDASDLSYMFEFATGACFPAHYRLLKVPLSSSGDFHVSLPPSDNPYLLFLRTWGRAGNPPTVYLTIGPISVSEVTSTVPIEKASASTGTITLTSLTTLEVPFMQTYGSWIVAAIIAAVVLVLLLISLNDHDRNEEGQTLMRKRNVESLFVVGRERFELSTTCIDR